MSDLRKGPARHENAPGVPDGRYSSALIPLLVDCASLTVDPANARRHPERNLEAIKGSLARFGQQKPIVVDEGGVVIAGNGTLEAARALGWGQIAAVRSSLAGADRAAFGIADNRTAELAEWDEAALVTSLGDDEGLLDAIGFDEGELHDLLGPKDGETDPDDVPEVPVEAKTHRGDLIVMGRHRLLCGDSTCAEDVTRVMGGEKAVLMNTDPPYGIGYVSLAKAKGQADAFRDIENDDLSGAALQAFLEASIRAVIPHLGETPAFYLWHPMLTQGTFFAAAAAAAAAADILIHRQIIWVKPSLVLGHGDYHWRHELCFYGWIRGRRCPWLQGRDQTTVWEIGRQNDGGHPTQKPVELFTVPIENHTVPGDVVYEPFAGSGPQFIAAEQLNRRCFGMEIEPRYCDVIVLRWQKFTGKLADGWRGNEP